MTDDSYCSSLPKPAPPVKECSCRDIELRAAARAYRDDLGYPDKVVACMAAGAILLAIVFFSCAGYHYRRCSASDKSSAAFRSCCQAQEPSADGASEAPPPAVA